MELLYNETPPESDPLPRPPDVDVLLVFCFAHRRIGNKLPGQIDPALDLFQNVVVLEEREEVQVHFRLWQLSLLLPSPLSSSAFIVFAAAGVIVYIPTCLHSGVQV